MNRIEELFLKHKHISNFAFNNFNSLVEMKYQVPGVADLFTDFRDAVLRKINNKQEGVYDLRFDEKIFKSHTFFKKINLTLHLEFISEDEEVKSNSHTDTENCAVDYKHEQVNNLEMVIDLRTNKYNFIPLLGSMFCHEMLHAYEDLQRKLKTEGFETINKYALLSGYFQLPNFDDSNNPQVKALQYVLYHLHQIEQRAFIAGGIAELRLRYKQDQSLFGQSPYQSISKTKGYKQLSDLCGRLDELMSVYDKEKQAGLLKMFNSRKALIGKLEVDNVEQMYRKMQMGGYPQGVQFYRFTTYNQLMKFLNIKVDHIFSNYLNELMKEADQLQSLKLGHIY